MFLELYLKQREQVVSICVCESDPSLLFYDVPQGSVLGPILFILYKQPLSDVINHHSVPQIHMFADDTELYKSETRDNIDSVLTAMQTCVSDVKQWTLHNKLQLNEDKTEALLIDPSKFPSHPESLMIGQDAIMFSDSARNVSVMFDKTVNESTGWQGLPGRILRVQKNRINQTVPQH